MSLLTEAQEATRSRGGTCGVTILLESLSPAEQAELSEALASNVQSAALARALVKRGHRVSQAALARHRRGECQCR